MSTVIPQNEMTRRAMDWICEQCAGPGATKDPCSHIEAAAARFNLGPLDVEFLIRFYAAGGKGENAH